MAKVNMTNVVVAVGAGGVDEVMEWQDGKKGRVESFKNWTDWSRLILVGLGYIGQITDMMVNIAVPLAQSETTLLTKSVGRAIRTKMATPAPAPATRRVGQYPGAPFKREFADARLS